MLSARYVGYYMHAMYVPRMASQTVVFARSNVRVAHRSLAVSSSSFIATSRVRVCLSVLGQRGVRVLSSAALGGRRRRADVADRQE